MTLAETLTALGIVDADSRERILCAAKAERLAAVLKHREELIAAIHGLLDEREEETA